MQDVKKLAYEVLPDEDGAACIRCEGSETGTIYPEEVSAHVINKLLEATTSFTGVSVDRAVISVPAYFNEDQQEATIAAGALVLRTSPFLSMLSDAFEHDLCFVMHYTNMVITDTR